MSDMNDILKRAAGGGPSAAFRETSFIECGPLAYIFFEFANGTGHFFGLARGIDGGVAIYDDWSRVALLASEDVFVRKFGISNTRIFFEYTACGGEVAPRGGWMALRGSGVSNACQLCNGRLYVHRVAQATILTHKGTDPITYTVNRCCRESRRAKFGPNSRVSGARGLINTISKPPGGDDILVITPSYAISADYLKLYYNRLFRGKLPLSAESSAVFANNGDRCFPNQRKYAEVLPIALCYYFRLLDIGSGVEECYPLASIEFPISHSVEFPPLYTAAAQGYFVIFDISRGIPGYDIANCRSCISDGTSYCLGLIS